MACSKAGAENSSVYVKRHGHWHFVLNFEGSKWVEDAEVDTFRVLTETFAVDSHRVYWNGKPVAGADPSSFVPLTSFIGKDSTQVFLQEDKFFSPRQLDVTTLESLRGSYLRDRNGVYCLWYSYDSYDCDRVDCDPETFRALDDTFGVDAQHVFNHGTIEASLDAATFERISPYFARDATDVYFLNFGGKSSEQVVLEALNAEASSFRLLSERYARDATAVFFYYNCGSLARKRHLWVECSRVDVEADAFRLIERERLGDHDFPDATDGTSLFLYGRRLPLPPTDFRLRDEEGLVYVEGVDLDAMYAFLASEDGGAERKGDPATLGPIDHPTRIADEYRRWLVTGDECRLSMEDRSARRRRLHGELGRAWASLESVGELRTACSLASWLLPFEVELLVAALQARSTLPIEEALEVYAQRFEMLFELEVPEDSSTWWLSAVNNAIAQMLGHPNHPSELKRLERWASFVLDQASDNKNLPHNLACVLALVGRLDDAFDMCALAMAGGYRSWEKMRDDVQLAELREQSRFVDLFSDVATTTPSDDEDIPF